MFMHKYVAYAASKRCKMQHPVARHWMLYSYMHILHTHVYFVCTYTYKYTYVCIEEIYHTISMCLSKNPKLRLLRRLSH